MKIGLLGGTFNPIHNAHLEIAARARSACSLERVLFIPAADPPHKKLAGDVPFSARCRMISLAIAANPFFELSPLEGERSGKSYSIDTVRLLREQMPDDELYFIIGSDSFLEIGSWHRYDEIFGSCNIVVLERPGCATERPLDTLPAGIQSRFRHDPATMRLHHDSGFFVQFLPDSMPDISSTVIRKLSAEGKSINGLVPEEVAAYISEQRIYQQCL